MGPSGRLGAIRRALGGLRWRTTLGAAAVVALALLIATFALVVLLRRSLTTNIEEAVVQRADDLAALLEADPNAPLPVRDAEDLFVQVVGPNRTIVRVSENLSPLSEPVVETEAGDVTRIDEAPVGDDEGPFAVAAASATLQGDEVLVLVGQSLEPAVESGETLTRLLVYGAPLLLLVIGGVTWRVVGRSLRPVEDITREVGSITSSDLHRRVPQPDTDDEIERLAATMNEMLARLEAAHDRQRRFVSDASHELKSPIASIRQHVELSMRNPDAIGQEELTAVVRQENERLQKLVEDLLLLARLDEGHPATTPEQLDVDDIVFEEAKRLRELPGVTIDAAAVSGGRVKGDRKGVSVAVRNLMENAVRHCRRVVAVDLNERDGWVELTVDDDGEGIPVERRSEVFERFTRLDEARTRDGGGSGLGLAIVAEVAAAHGGDVSITEAPLGGARVRLRLPSGPH